MSNKLRTFIPITPVFILLKQVNLLHVIVYLPVPHVHWAVVEDEGVLLLLPAVEAPVAAGGGGREELGEEVVGADGGGAATDGARGTVRNRPC